MTTQISISSLFLSTLFMGFLLIFPILMRSPYDPNTDQQLIEACRYYADHHPEASIPDERKAYLTQTGVDWEHYNYYQDCIDQKKIDRL